MARTLSTTNVPAAIAQELRRDIGRGELRPGDRLPSHRELSARFGVSLGSVREAISALVSEGVLETRAGSGTFVGVSVSPALSTPSELLDREVLEELLEAREMLEASLVALAAARRTADDLQRLREALSRMTASIRDPAAYAEADVEFHLLLAQAARNRVLLRAMSDIRGLLKRDMELSAEVGARRHGDLGFSIAAHQEILTALEDRDVTKAREVLEATMRRHHEFVLSLYPPRSPAGEKGA